MAHPRLPPSHVHAGWMVSATRTPTSSAPSQNSLFPLHAGCMVSATKTPTSSAPSDTSYCGRFPSAALLMCCLSVFNRKARSAYCASWGFPSSPCSCALLGCLRVGFAIKRFARRTVHVRGVEMESLQLVSCLWSIGVIGLDTELPKINLIST